VNGAHDMGGMHGFGAVAPRPGEPRFHDEWEKRVLALVLAMGALGRWNIDTSRSARENRDPADYLDKSYYEIWLAGLERLVKQFGLVGPDELAAGRSLRPPASASPLHAADVPAMLARGGPTTREAPRPARFAVRDRVRAVNINPQSHTRLPRYVRGREGVIELVHGCHVFPDSNAYGRGEDPQWLYTVRFEATELWGPDADPRSAVSVDAFEPYLQ
jgi:nitrile hydratase beta subunit